MKDPNVDLARFRGANHWEVTLLEVLDTSDAQNIHVKGWRLACMRCGLIGMRIYQDVDIAHAVAVGLRSRKKPECSPGKLDLKEGQ